MLDFGATIRRCGIALLLLFSIYPLDRAQAVVGTLDNVPAATLLYPYFEVDLSNANGKNTVVALHNTSATAILGRVTLWSNTAVPLYNFNIYLTGYDVQSFSMRDVLNGTLPRTASAGQDPADTISHKGPQSQDINFASCNGQLPYSPVNPSYVADLQAMLTGHPSTTQFAGQCVGTNAGDNVARGFLTIDTVNSCSGSGIPTGLPQYFDTNFFMTYQNVLLGDYLLTDPSQHVMYSANATAIEADQSAPETNTPGLYTFYGRFVNWTAADHREPLATNWMLMGDTGNSSSIVWRDPKVSNPSSFSCGIGYPPSWAPLGQEGITFMNRAGQPTFLPRAPTVTDPFPPPLDFAPVATQLARLDSTTMQLPDDKMGFLAMGLNTTIPAAGSNPPADPAAAQSLVVLLSTQKNQPNLSTGLIAVPRDTAQQPIHGGQAPGIE